MIVRSLLQKREPTSDMPILPLSAGMRGSWLWEALGGGIGETVAINERTAMQLSAVWTCVNIRAGLLASLPLKVYQRQNRGRREARGNPFWKLLHDQPSTEDTSYTWRHFTDCDYLLSGNGYGELERDGANRVRAIYPWPKSVVRVEYGSRRGDYWYIITDQSGERRVESYNMLHLRGFRHCGVEGLSVIQNHRRGLGLGARTELFAQNFYDNGARASGVLMYPGKLSDKGRENLTSSFDSASEDNKYGGVHKTGKTILLEEGAKYQQLTIPPNDAQFLETRQLSRAEIAGIFRIPTMLVPGADSTPPTYASSESFMRYIIDVTLRDDLTIWQQELNSKLFAGTDLYAEFDTRDLLRADAAGRAALYKTFWEIGQKSANDIADDENENPVPGGDRYYVQSSYIPTDRIDEWVDAQVEKSKPQVAAPSAGDGGQAQGGSNAGGRQVGKGYKRLFVDVVKEIQQWTRFDEKRAADRITLLVLRPVADDLIGEERGDSIISDYAAELSKRIKSLTPESLGEEFDKAVEAISHGGIQ